MIAALPPRLRALDAAERPYPVTVSDRLRADADALAARLASGRKNQPLICASAILALPSRDILTK